MGRNRARKQTTSARLAAAVEVREELGARELGDERKVTDPTGAPATQVLLASDALANSKARRYFKRHLDAVVRLDHPRLVTIREGGTDDGEGRGFLLEEAAEGRTVEQELSERQAGLPFDDALRVALDVLAALDHAHQRRLVHGALSPKNVLLTSEQGLRRGRLLDLGFARVVGAELTTPFGPLRGDADYAAPEAIKGEPLCPRADVFSAGALLFLLLTGRHPIPAPPKNALLLRLNEAPEALPADVCPDPARRERLNEVLRRAMAKDPARRYGSALALARALRGDPAEAAPADDPRVWSAALPEGGGCSACNDVVPALTERPWSRKSSDRPFRCVTCEREFCGRKHWDPRSATCKGCRDKELPAVEAERRDEAAFALPAAPAVSSQGPSAEPVGDAATEAEPASEQAATAEPGVAEASSGAGADGGGDDRRDALRALLSRDSAAEWRTTGGSGSSAASAKPAPSSASSNRAPAKAPSKDAPSKDAPTKDAGSKSARSKAAGSKSAGSKSARSKAAGSKSARSKAVEGQAAGEGAASIPAKAGAGAESAGRAPAAKPGHGRGPSGEGAAATEAAKGAVRDAFLEAWAVETHKRGSDGRVEPSRGLPLDEAVKPESNPAQPEPRPLPPPPRPAGSGAPRTRRGGAAWKVATGALAVTVLALVWERGTPRAQPAPREVSDLELKLGRAQTSREELYEQNVTLERDLDRARADAKRTSTELAQSSGEVERLVRELSAAVEAKERLEGARVGLKARVAQVLEQRDAASARGDALEDTLKRKERLLSILIEETEVLKGQLAQAAEQRDAASARADALEGQLAQAAEQRDAASARADAFEGQLAQTVEQRDAANARAVALEEQRVEISAAREALRRELSAQVAAGDALRQAGEDLRRDLAQAADAQAELKRELERRAARLRAAQEQVTALSSARDELTAAKAETAEIAGIARGLEQRAEDREARIEALAAEVEATRRQGAEALIQAIAAADRLQAQARAHEERARQLEQERAALEATAAALRAERDALRAEHVRLEAELFARAPRPRTFPLELTQGGQARLTLAAEGLRELLEQAADGRALFAVHLDLPGATPAQVLAGRSEPTDPLAPARDDDRDDDGDGARRFWIQPEQAKRWLRGEGALVIRVALEDGAQALTGGRLVVSTPAGDVLDRWRELETAPR